jgi:TetR/AcrR family transcriptional regulator
MATAQVRYSAADRRVQILESATQLFARQGFQGTTTKQISEYTGVTEALIFRHFASKDDLYWAVIERKITAAAPGDHMRERLSAGGSDLEVLSGVASQILERRAKDQTLSRLLLYTALENHRLSHRFFRTYVAECYEVLADYIRRRVADGAFRPVDPLLAARGFLGMVVYHSWIQELFGGKRFQSFSVQQVSKTLAEVWLHGMQSTAEIASPPGSAKSNNGNRNRSRQETGNHVG